MPIDADEVLRIAKLARLEFEPKSVPRLRRQMQSILDYVATLEELDVSDLPPTVATRFDAGAPREDRTSPSLPREDALRNAPDHAQGLFRVPRVLKA